MCWQTSQTDQRLGVTKTRIHTALSKNNDDHQICAIQVMVATKISPMTRTHTPQQQEAHHLLEVLFLRGLKILKTLKTIVLGAS
jgi:SOS response regulatory protein OraA/RecX